MTFHNKAIGGRPDPEGIAAEMHGDSKKHEPVDECDERESRKHGRAAEQPPIAVPTLVLHGSEDADNFPETTEGKDRYFTGTYTRRVLPGVGHFVPREAPHDTAVAIREFAAQHW